MKNRLNLHLNKQEKIFIVATTLLFLLMGTVGWFLFGAVVFGILLALEIAILLTLQIEFFRRIEQMYYRMIGTIQEADKQICHHLQQDYRQVEALFSLVPALKLNAPLPPTRDWAGSPDFLKIIATLIYETQPTLILELGSGVSTLVAGYCLKNIGEGRLISADHHPQYAGISQNNLVLHNIQEVASIVLAPIKEIDIKGEKWLWYDPEKLAEINKIDMLIVDGPPGDLQKLSRYPALPLLFERLNHNAAIVVDDGDRTDERKTVELWLKEFDGLTAEKLTSEKGAYILRKTNQQISNHNFTNGQSEAVPDTSTVNVSQ